MGLILMVVKVSGKFGKDLVIFFFVFVMESISGFYKVFVFACFIMWLDYYRERRWLLNSKITEKWGDVLVFL